MTSQRYLSRADALAAGALDWAAARDDIAEVLRLHRAGAAEMVAESVLPVGADPREKAYGLPARVGGAYAAAGIKWTVHRAAAASAEEEAITSMTLIEDLQTNRPLGMVESALLTRVRTAAVSAAAISALCPQVRRVAVLGAGAQARGHLAMLAALHPGLEEVRLWARSPGRIGPLIQGLALPQDWRLQPSDSPEAAVGGADLVLCCTSAPEPILGAWAVAPGRAIFQVGFHEVAFPAIAASEEVTVDLWGDYADKSAKSLFQMYRAGLFAPERVAADLPAMLLDGWRPAPGASVYFSSFGLNLFDIALAARLLRQAAREGIGTLLAR